METENGLIHRTDDKDGAMNYKSKPGFLSNTWLGTGKKRGAGYTRTDCKIRAKREKAKRKKMRKRR